MGKKIKRTDGWKELKFSLYRNILITLEITPPHTTVRGEVSFHRGGEQSCWECCRSAQKCHCGCRWQSLIVHWPFSGRWIQAVHTKSQSNTQQPPISLSRNWQKPQEKGIKLDQEFGGEGSKGKALSAKILKLSRVHFPPIQGKGYVCMYVCTYMCEYIFFHSPLLRPGQSLLLVDWERWLENPCFMASPPQQLRDTGISANQEHKIIKKQTKAGERIFYIVSRCLLYTLYFYTSLYSMITWHLDVYASLWFMAKWPNITW